MAKRYTDTTIWKKQRWFRKLSSINKLAWKYITDTCDHAGILKIDFSEFLEDLGVDEFDINDFINCCNVDYDKRDGKKIQRERIKLIKDDVVWITGFIKFQYENRDLQVNPAIPAIYSALTILNGYGTLNEGLNKGYLTLSQPYVKGMLRTKDKDNNKDNNKEEDFEKFSLLKIYNKEFNQLNGSFKELTEKGFLRWKKFIDFIYKNRFQGIFKFNCINPQDFEKLDFPETKWTETIKGILSTGVKEEHNLFFRIPQFIKYAEKGKVEIAETSIGIPHNLKKLNQ